MFGHMLESSHRGDSNKRSNKGFGEEITQLVSIEINLMHLIWSPVCRFIIILVLKVFALSKDCICIGADPDKIVLWESKGTV